MSSLLIAHDSQIMMLEFVVEKLFVPSNSPFDAVILSKYIVSFRFLDDEWTDVTPNRTDYKQYRGSRGTEQLFHGGKSLVVSVPSSFLDFDSESLSLEIRARREISRYFEAEEHSQEIGSVLVNVDELLNGIVAEMRLRRELGDYLALVHERDPISRSMKGTFDLRTANDDTLLPQLELYLRLSYLGSSVVTEIDRASSDSFFYAQEETNLGDSSRYECRELDASGIPTKATGRPIFSAKLECACTDDQKYRLLQPDGTRTQETTTTQEDEDHGMKEGKKKGGKKKKRLKEKGTITEPESADKAIGTTESKGSRETKDGEEKDKDGAGKQRRKELTDAERMRLIRSKRRGGGGTVGIVDRSRKTCVVPAVPCYSADICITKPTCLPVCSPAPEPPAVCCYN